MAVLRWYLTVRSAMPSSAAIVLLARPWATSRRMARVRGVSAGGGAATCATRRVATGGWSSEPPAATTEDVWYFPCGPQGLGHAVSNFAPDGTRTGFKDFFDKSGRETTFGYPMEEPKRRGDLWTQRFQAGILEYHAEFDRDGDKPGTDMPWRTWTVQLRLLGDEYIQQHQLAFR